LAKTQDDLAKELGIEEVLCDVRRFESEEEILKQLIETNMRQRGIGNMNSVKMMRCEDALEEIYGIQRGRPTSEKIGTGFPIKTQEQLAKEEWT